MKIGVLSDSHDNLPLIRKAVQWFNARDDLELVIHGGDIVAPFSMKQLLELRVPLRAVYGNNDGEREGLRKLLPGICESPVTWQIGGRNVAVAHAIDDLGDPTGLDVIICGHDHKANIEPGPPLKVNPGECGGWLTGRATVAVIDLQHLTAKIVELK